eukprot:scaffold163165_cov34-Tisochrysis_lutea.AAC.1
MVDPAPAPKRRCRRRASFTHWQGGVAQEGRRRFGPCPLYAKEAPCGALAAETSFARASASLATSSCGRGMVPVLSFECNFWPAGLHGTKFGVGGWEGTCWARMHCDEQTTPTTPPAHRANETGGGARAVVGDLKGVDRLHCLRNDVETEDRPAMGDGQSMKGSLE